MLILEFTQDRIKLCEAARKKQGPVLASLAKRPIVGLSDAELPGVILELLAKSGVKKKRPLVLCVARHLFTARNLRLPSVDDVELRTMAALQAGKQLPYPASELLWDFRIVEKRQDGYSDISLMLGHRNVVDRFVDILKKANLKVERIALSSEAILGWHLAICRVNEDGKGQAVQNKAIVDIDTAHVDIVVLRGESLEYSRCFPVKHQPQETADELMKTFRSYEKESSRPIPSILLTGIEEKAQAIKALLEGSGIAGPIEFIHPLKVVSLDYREKLADYFETSKDISFSCILGAAYSPQAMKMDFLPPEIKTERARGEKRRLYAKTALLAALACFVLSGIFAKEIMDKKSALQMLALKIRETEPKVKRLREQYKNIEIIRRSLNMNGSSIDVMREVFRMTPQEVSIAVLDFELERSLVLRGVSSNLSDVFKFASGLKKSDYFEKCEIKYAQKRKVKEREFIDFEIDCRFGRMSE